MATGQTLFANIGFRYENQNGFSSFSPRINTAFEIFPQVKIRSGIGLATKAPSLANMFPGDVYFDVLIKDLRSADYAMNVVQTYFIKRSKVNLKPTKMWKFEAGTDITIPTFGRINLTAYYNKTFDGIEQDTHYGLYSIP